jgi:probable rRNA maturation factor
MLAHLGLEDVELSVALVDDRRIRELNKRHRKKDKATDVLAFPLGDETTGLLGDVVLSVDTARRQAGRARRPLLDELTMLLAHGLLHLVGFDHETDEQERVMNGWTQQLQAAATARARTRTGAPPRRGTAHKFLSGSAKPPLDK